MRWSVLLLTAMLLAACSDDSDTDDAAATTTESPGSTGTTSETTATTGPTGLDRCPQAPDGSSPAVFDDAAGTYAAFVTEVDLAAPSISFDVIQWLSGQDAIDAYHEDNPSDPEGPPNDYYIVNDSEQVRTAPVAGDATVWLVRLAGDSDAAVDAGTVEELPDYLAAGFDSDVYWLTFDDGEVTEICEQYRP